jgi:hypothetical protein
MCVTQLKKAAGSCGVELLELRFLCAPKGHKSLFVGEEKFKG